MKTKWTPLYCDLCDYKSMGQLGVATARVVVNEKGGCTRDIFDVCEKHAKALERKYSAYDVGVDPDFWDKLRKRWEAR